MRARERGIEIERGDVVWKTVLHSTYMYMILALDKQNLGSGTSLKLELKQVAAETRGQW